MFEKSKDSEMNQAKVICAKIDLPKFCHHCNIIPKDAVNLWRSQVDTLYVNCFETTSLDGITGHIGCPRPLGRSRLTYYFCLVLSSRIRYACVEDT